MAQAIVDTGRIRNVIVLGHTGTGKSTVVESMLAAAGHPAHRTSGVCPTMDFEPEEQDKGRSLSVALASFEFRGCKINVLDAPGGAESIGDAYPALPAADTALFVVDATVGVQPQHEELWKECEARDIPRLVYLNKLDLERAQYQPNVDRLRDLYGKRIAPVHMPLGVEAELTGIIDLLHFHAATLDDAGKRVEIEVPDERREQAERNREALVEAVVETDDDLLERYFEGEVPDSKELAAQFAKGIADCGFFPLLCGAAEHGLGATLLLEFIVGECPSPADGPRPVDRNRPTAAYVAKTLSDQYVGRINILRVLSGELQADATLTDVRTGDSHRLHQLFSLRGKEQLPVDGAAAGDLVAVAKLEDVETGDVLSADGRSVELDVPQPPEGYHRVVLEPVSAADEDKLSTALQRMVHEDPAIGVTRDEDAGLQILSFLGPSHVDVTLRRLERKFGVHARAEPAPIAFRETIRSAAQGVGKHVKQSGGHGQYGVAHIELSPLPRGAGFVFEDAIVGGVIPRNFIPSVEKGVVEAMRAGPLGGHSVVDVKVRLFDGKEHSVDSSDAAFQMAGILAFREAVKATQPVLLEPVIEVDIAVPEDLTGAVMSDLSSRRGRIMGTDAAGAGQTMIHAQVPEVELQTFVPEFRALTSGRGSVAMRYSHHEEVPDQIAKRLVATRGEA